MNSSPNTKLSIISIDQIETKLVYQLLLNQSYAIKHNLKPSHDLLKTSSSTYLEPHICIHILKVAK